MNPTEISEALDCDGWPIVVGCHVKVTGQNKGRGKVVMIERCKLSGELLGLLISYRDREGRMRSAWATTCTVVPASPKAKHRQELANYQLEQASKGLTRKRRG